MNPSSAEDAALRAFLTEALGGASPPDLSEQILHRLSDSSADPAKPADCEVLSPNPLGTRKTPLAAAAALIVAVAAVLLALLTLQPQADPERPHPVAQSPNGQSPNGQSPNGQSPDEQSPIAQNPDEQNPNGQSPGANSPETAPRVAQADADAQPDPSGLAAAAEDAAAQPAPRSRQLPMQETPFAPAARVASEQAVVDFERAPRVPPHDAQQIAAELNRRFEQAWKQLGVEPTAEVSQDEVAQRISRWVGTDVSPSSASDPAALAEVLRGRAASESAAERLLAQLLGSAWRRLPAERQQVLSGFIAQTYSGQQRFDVAAQQLVVGGTDQRVQRASAIWLTSLAGERSVPVTQQIGHAVLDLDLACARCHDDPLDSQIRQQDFWGLAAVFQNGLRYSRSQSGEPLVQAVSESERQKGQFFELPDGRQRVALPGVPPQWLDLQVSAPTGEEPAGRVLKDLQTLVAQWRDNPRLAKALVNRVWNAVYGRPLTGSTADPEAPPHEEHLVQLRDYLAAQTRAHDFDLARLTAWVLTAPPMHRAAVLEPLSDEAAFASDQQLARADFLHRTFAGYQPQPVKLRFGSLLDLVSRWNGRGTIESVPALAQPAASSGSFVPLQAPSEAELTENWLRTSFPERGNAAAPLPAQWLGAIEDFEQQARHLYYAAGYWKPSGRQLKAAAELRESTGDDDAALKQLWWVIRNSR
ncbi:DUF1549 domain-containing protein [Roseimaritima sediminicola]|uniref:DUF1549 domain-containing protein n=1 Tax=Roseimaritima sediminicola TaxID=2662066 RepID=UPI0012982EF1|nr:DUF1549 domain-containing protein [Roseimaritima sediminicola]